MLVGDAILACALVVLERRTKRAASAEVRAQQAVDAARTLRRMLGRGQVRQEPLLLFVDVGGRRSQPRVPRRLVRHTGLASHRAQLVRIPQVRLHVRRRLD